jgi:transposase
MDECGIQEDITREKGRIGKSEIELTKVTKQPKAQKLYGQTTATKHNKTGVISGYARLPVEINPKNCYQYISPMVYDDTCNANTFNAWLEFNFIPDAKKLQKLYPDNYIALVLDNVPYHKSIKTKELCEQNGITLIFQPPYSPDLNPIEPSWGNLKDEIRNQIFLLIPFMDKLFNAINRITWSCC